MYQMAHDGKNWIVTKENQLLVKAKSQTECWEQLTQNHPRDFVNFKSPIKLVQTTRGKYITKSFAFAEYPKVIIGSWEGYRSDWKCVPGIKLTVKTELQLRKLCRDYGLSSNDYATIAEKIEKLGFELND